MVDDLLPVKRALISVSDKEGLIELTKSLVDRGVEIISTGGTANYLSKEGIRVTEIFDITKFPELMDGRLKTLHPKVHGGLLALRDNEEHLGSLRKYGIPTIDLLVVNLYPFEQAILEEKDFSEIVEKIDVGGPAMIRAAAKNFKYVSVVVDLEDYELLLGEIRRNDGHTSLDFRKVLAETAFSRTAEYDAIIRDWMFENLKKQDIVKKDEMPRRFITSSKIVKKLRYGENPHQIAAYYRNSLSQGLFSTFNFHQGKELSFNNINDINCALAVLSSFDKKSGVTAAIIKHGNTCGVAVRKSSDNAYRAAYDSDRSSAFGGIIAMNGTLDLKTAKAVLENFTEIIIVPDVEPNAIKILSHKKNLRIISWNKDIDFRKLKISFRQVWDGLLVQDYDLREITEQDFSIVTKRKPTDSEIKDLLFAWKVAKYIKSNAIVFAKNMTTTGIGAGQMSRIDSARIATFKAQDRANKLKYSNNNLTDCVAASDAFFPFPDGIFQLVAAGVTAVIQPGGSIKDQDVIAAANKSGISMVFTNVRHFSH